MPQFLMTDQAGKFTGQDTDFVKHCCCVRIQLRHKEKGRCNQNHMQPSVRLGSSPNDGDAACPRRMFRDACGTLVSYMRQRFLVGSPGDGMAEPDTKRHGIWSDPQHCRARRL